MENASLELRDIPVQFRHYSEMVVAFLLKHELHYDETMEGYVGYFDGDTLVAGAGFSGNVIKCVAVDESLRGQGATNSLLSVLLKKLYEKGFADILLFTKPENEPLFSGAGFNTVETSSKALLMESDRTAFQHYLKNLVIPKQAGVSGAIVMNCNPFTLGHRYLVETAAARCDCLHVFLVEEDRSVFPYAVRKELVKKATQDIANITVHDGGQYIITSATFPSYFIKTDADVAAAQAELDLRIFGRHIAPALGITKRFVGEEPYCTVTGAYNQVMKTLLPQFGLEVNVIPRKELDGKAISASRVRQCIREGKLEETRDLIPKSTFDFLVSKQAEPIIDAIVKASSRHS